MTAPTTTGLGRQAEAAACRYLLNREYSIVTQNWRTPACEIDIIAQRYETIYFIEVKYRRRANWGSGFDYITPVKLRQMHFAAQLWLQSHRHVQQQPVLAAIEVGGPDFTVSNYLQLL